MFANNYLDARHVRISSGTMVGIGDYLWYGPIPADSWAYAYTSDIEMVRPKELRLYNSSVLAFGKSTLAIYRYNPNHALGRTHLYASPTGLLDAATRRDNVFFIENGAGLSTIDIKSFPLQREVIEAEGPLYLDGALLDDLAVLIRDDSVSVFKVDIPEQVRVVGDLDFQTPLERDRVIRGGIHNDTVSLHGLVDT